LQTMTVKWLSDLLRWARRWLVVIVAVGSVTIVVYTVLKSHHAVTPLTAVLAAGTWMLAALTYQLWESAEKTAQVKLRAYISIEKAQIEASGSNGGNAPNFDVPWTAVIIWRNSGQTPAHDFRTTLMAPEVHDFPPPSQPSGSFWKDDLHDPHADVGMLGANCTVFSHEQMVARVTQKVYGQVISGKKAIYVRGRCDYRDVFGKPHWYKFCLMHRGKHGISNEGQLILSGCIHGDDMDQAD